MVPEKLKLTNFCGIKAGLGLDEIEIDFTKNSDGIVILKGPNGTGKTTLLDNMHPYRLMPSKAKTYSTKSFSYYDEVYGSKAGKDLIWTHNGVRYKSIISLKMTGKTRSTTAFLQLEKNDKWTMFIHSDGTSSDGKTAPYDKCVEHVLGSPEMYFTAAFSSQNRKQLSAYTNGEIKSLMSELLNLDYISEHGENCGEVTKGLSAHLNELSQEKSILERTIGENINSKSLLSAMESEHLAMKSTYDNLVGLEKQAAKELIVAEEAAKNQEKNLERKRELQGALLSIDADIAGQNKLHNRMALDINEGTQRELRLLDTNIGNIDGLISESEKTIKESRECLENKDEAIKAQEQYHEGMNKLQEMRTEFQEYTKLRIAHQAAKDEWMVSSRNLTHLKTKLNATNDNLAYFSKQAKLMCEVPCIGSEMQNDCKLLNEAIEAEKSIKNLEEESSKGLYLISVAEAELQEKEAYGKTIQFDEQEASVKQRHITDMEKRLKQYEVFARQVELIPIYEKAITDQKEKLLTAKKQINELIKEREGINANNVIELKRLIDSKQQSDEKYEKDKQELTDRLAKYKDVAVVDVTLLKIKADSFAFSIRDAGVAIEDQLKKIHESRVRIETKVSAEKRIAFILSEINRINCEISHWNLLSLAFGNNGIIALSIDDSGPSISALTNDVLKSCYGPRFTVSIETQSETVKGKLKETFDVLVYDSESDTKKSLKDMSGGERVWITECLTRAIALYQHEQSGMNYETLFTDEVDGALDQERKTMFMEMKKTVRELGGYTREYCITHTPELWNMADDIIDLQQYKR